MNKRKEMALLDNLNQFYPNYSFCSIKDIYVVEEPPARDVTLTSVSFNKKDTTFTIFDMQIIKNLQSFFEPICSTGNKLHGSRHYDIFMKDCDGLFFYDKEDKMHLVAVELKSGFSTQEVFKAFSQILGTIYKTIMLLNPLSCFNREDLIYIGYICIHEHKDPIIFKRSLSKQKIHEKNEIRKTELAFVSSLYIKKEVTLEPRNCHHLKSFNLSNVGIFNKIVIKLELVPIPNLSHSIEL